MNGAAMLVQYEGPLRLVAFAAALLLLAVLQWRWPARGDGRPARRQLTNLSLVAIDTLVLRVLFPVLAVGFATAVQARGGGLLGALAWPAWLEFVLAVLAFDLTIYWQHRLHHGIPILWRLHRVHHSDTAFDVTTGVRFHPFEIALSMAIKLGLVWLLGPSPAAVVVFEILLSLSSLITHADVALPPGVDRRLRWVVVTPSMHRIHHSTSRLEHDRNYGFHLSLWDRLFRSYCAAPALPETTMPLGLSSFRTAVQQRFLPLLLQPFRSASTCEGSHHA